jgi:hypothetical protein
MLHQHKVRQTIHLSPHVNILSQKCVNIPVQKISQRYTAVEVTLPHRKIGKPFIYI